MLACITKFHIEKINITSLLAILIKCVIAVGSIGKRKVVFVKLMNLHDTYSVGIEGALDLQLQVIILKYKTEPQFNV